MATFSEAFSNWKDFPKGLSVLLVDGDLDFLQKIKCNLESYGYCVTGFSTGQEACALLANHSETFHVALVEATEIEDVGSCRMLEFSKIIPTIVISAMENMSLMVKTIALGAVEFLVKPLSEDKLKNIWQHVVRKAIDTRDDLEPGYLKPGRQYTAAHENHPNGNSNERLPRECTEKDISSASCSRATPASCEPSTPQIVQRERMALEGPNFDDSPRSPGFTERVTDKEKITLESTMCELLNSCSSAHVKSESLDTMFDTPRIVTVKQENADHSDHAKTACCSNIQKFEPSLVKEDDNIAETNYMESVEAEKDDQQVEEGMEYDDKRTSGDGCNHEYQENISPKGNGDCQNTDPVFSSKSPGHDRKGEKERDDIKRKLTGSDNTKKDKSSNNKKKMKVDWTTELHRRFVQAVEYLGVDQAIPSRILEVMKVEGLTRHNVASHLQKYRSQKRHLLARETESSSWHQQRFNSSKTWKNGQSTVWIQPRPQIFYPPLHVWGHPAGENPAFPGMPQYSWPAHENYMWQHPMVDGCVPGILCGNPTYTQPMKSFACLMQGSTATDIEDAENLSCEAANRHGYPTSTDVHPSKEQLDAAIGEALNNPWTPLPLGLKPPSMESVMAELQRQGINTVSIHMK